MAGHDSEIFYSDDKYEIRPAKNTDEFREMWWAFMQELGWNRGYYDLDTYMNPSTASGMLLLIDKSSNKPIGHVAAVMDSNRTGWISMFIIDKAHRGKGMGRELFKAGIEDAKRAGYRVMGLDGVVEQKETYERRDFVESPLGKVRIMIRSLLAKEPLPKNEGQADGSLVNIHDVPLDLLVQHETKYTGFVRPRLWSKEHMFNRPDAAGHALVSRSPPQSVDDIKGWTVIRRCSGGIRIGPLYAQDAEAAKKVLIAAMETGPKYIKDIPLPKEPISDLAEEKIADEGTLVTEVWGGNPEAVKLFENLGWKPAGVDYHRMWLDGKALPEWEQGGVAQKGVFATFDAAAG